MTIFLTRWSSLLDFAIYEHLVNSNAHLLLAQIKIPTVTRAPNGDATYQHLTWLTQMTSCIGMRPLVGDATIVVTPLSLGLMSGFSS